MRYVCLRCGMVSREGMAIGNGPWCGKCGVEMKLDPLRTPAKKPEALKGRPTPPGLASR